MSSTALRTRRAAVAELLGRPLASYQLVLGLTGLLLGIGLLMVLSASSVYSRIHYGNAYYIFAKQLVFAVGGVVGFVVALRTPLSLWKRLAPWLLAGAVALVLLTFTPLGIRVHGNRNWLPLFAGVNLQPSEFLKFGLIVWMARIYDTRHKYLTTPRYVITPVVPVAVAATALVVLQHDLGTALVLFAIIFGMVWVAGLPIRHLLVMLSALSVVLLVLVRTNSSRTARVFSFLDPWADPYDTGLQATKALIGFAHGGILGLGLGASRQKWGALPEAHNDFILAVIGEELGLAGTLVVLLLFVGLGFAGLRIAMRTGDNFARFVATGITVWITAQAAINIGMVIGVLPVIGLPLPLISYGGSSLLITLVALGLLANCATTEPGAARALTLARRARKRGR